MSPIHTDTRSRGTHHANLAAACDPPAYDWTAIERRWQTAWAEADVFKAPKRDPEDSRYIFAACPFTSGTAHMGHIRSYTIADAFARFRRSCGDAVLFAMGFDAFGLPAELEATRRNTSPTDWVRECSRSMQNQFVAMGFSFDPERAFITSDESMYRWSQWLFLFLLDQGLIYRRKAKVNWCVSCMTVLAQSQVAEGCCWRCGGAVEAPYREQWFLRVKQYAPENHRRLPSLRGWDKRAVGAQHEVLGRVEGVELVAHLLSGDECKVFTSHLSELAEAAFIAVSPAHPELAAWVGEDGVGHIIEASYADERRKDRHAESVPIVDARQEASVPGVDRMLPVVVTSVVDARYGATAVLGNPRADATDKIIADRICEMLASPTRVRRQPVEYIETARYLVDDLPMSRQRGWGAPVPLIHCGSCGTVPVAVDDLPVKLPQDLHFTGAGNPLDARADFVDCRCPSCGSTATRETDTLDCHVDGLWMWIPLCVPERERAGEMFTHSELARWLPVSQVVWGSDGGHYILDQRTLAKMLRDGGLLPPTVDGEPFAGVLMHDMVTYGGRKMSKHLENGVNPNELIRRFGADTVRLAVLYSAAPRNPLNWTGDEVRDCHSFLVEVWRFATPRLHDRSGVGSIDTGDPLRRRLATWCDTATRKITNDLASFEMHRAARNVRLLFRRIKDFEIRTKTVRDYTTCDEAAVRVALVRLLRLMSPMTPHICEELWSMCGGLDLLESGPWPRAMGNDYDIATKG
jgi:leucyl-tRNA synthetase